MHIWICSAARALGIAHESLPGLWLLLHGLPLLPAQGQRARPPVVVMAHGIAGQKDMGLQPFAEAFARAGLAVLLFDYRCFGGSDGEPRNWVSPARHLQDWTAALEYVRVRALGYHLAEPAHYLHGPPATSILCVLPMRRLRPVSSCDLEGTHARRPAWAPRWT